VVQILYPWKDSNLQPRGYLPTTAFAANIRCLWSGLSLHPEGWIT